LGVRPNDEREKMKYEVVVSANIRTVWQADNEQEALRLADEWVRQEYGDLIHKANLDVREIS
jgi:hypothetical protein